MSWSLLERFFESEHFNRDPSLAVAYLSRYATHVGIQYILCSKLRTFAYDEIEFYLPQLCHLLVSTENESMALEEFVLDLCQESVSGALVTFWLFQTQLHDLSNTPTSPYFKTCRRIFNKVQHIVFGSFGTQKTEKICENALPTTVLASIILAGVASPFLAKQLGSIAVAQARKPNHDEETISGTPQIHVQRKLSRSHTISGSSGAARERRPRPQMNPGGSHAPVSTPAVVTLRTVDQERPSSSRAQSAQYSEARLSPDLPDGTGRPTSLNYKRLSTASLPGTLTTFDEPENGRRKPKTRLDFLRKPSSKLPTPAPLNIPREEQVYILRSNYFRSQTQFLGALEGISQRLVVVPKPARLSALRAELALIARDLPAEVDIPLLCPATLVDGSPSKSKHHRIVRINPAEATSLNSAERVPYLLMVEVLRDDFDFDPDTEQNQSLIAKLVAQKESGLKRRLFDIGFGARLSIDVGPMPGTDSVFEPETGDLGSSGLLHEFNEEELSSLNNPGTYTPTIIRAPPPRSSSGAATRSSASMLSTPRTSDALSRTSSPAHRSIWQGAGRTQMTDQADISALATHMRTAAQMLAQLETSGSKRPRQEVEAIKQKIIASMQLLEEQNFSAEDPSHTATFDSIIASVQSNSTPESPPELDESGEPGSPTAMGTGAGAARMENDEKIGGIQRKGDRDDPSAATFGEDWKSKRERIRRGSPYGYMRNWDLLSVIVKTGSDLRQEMFATQLIRICSKMWRDAGVPVWVKEMKILVTGESSGLIETIANGVSLHSLKRSLTLASIAAGTNTRKRIATLKDHFVRTFGEVDTPGYKAAADAFMRSLAAYSIISYVLQLKDRHNGNLLIDNLGHMMHIDFGFMLSNSPGSVGFEAAPFKLTHEFAEVLGGAFPPSPLWEQYKALCKQAFQELRKSAENLISVVEMMGKESKMACFASGGSAYVVGALRQRLVLQMGREEAEVFVEDLIAKSLGSYYTRLYDTFQYRTQGIY